MDGLCYAAGCGPSVRLGGRRLLLKGRTIGDYGIIESEILKQRGNPFDLIRAAARRTGEHADRQRYIVDQLFRHICRWGGGVSFHDTIKWLNTSYGACFALWLAVRDNDPLRYTFEHVCDLAGTADWNEISQAISIASAEDERALAQCSGVPSDLETTPMPWPLIYRRMAASPFCLRAGEIEKLTLYQLSILLRGEEEWQERLEFESISEIESWRREFNAAAERAVENLVDGRRFDANREHC